MKRLTLSILLLFSAYQANAFEDDLDTFINIEEETTSLPEFAPVPENTLPQKSPQTFGRKKSKVQDNHGTKNRFSEVVFADSQFSKAEELQRRKKAKRIAERAQERMAKRKHSKSSRRVSQR